MANHALEKRLALLESQVDLLREEVQANKGSNWQRAVEKYSGDDDLQAVFSAALKLREVDRKRARQKRGKRDNEK